MRKLFAVLIAVAAITPAYADTMEFTPFDFGDPSPGRVALVGFICKSCFGATSVVVNGVQLKRDVTTGGSEVAEIWSAPLPDGSGPLEIVISSDHQIDDDSIIATGSLYPQPSALTSEGYLRATYGAEQRYVLGVEAGDTVFVVSKGEFPRSVATPAKKISYDRLRAVAWDIEHADPSFAISDASSTSVVAVYR